jgi:hypothetical protein
MRTAVAVAGYNRPAHFLRLLQSLAQNPESQTLPFYFFLDGGHSSKIVAHQDIIGRSSIKEKYLIARDKNWGLGRNLIDVRRHLFETDGFDRIVLFEDDHEVTPQYLSLVLNLADWGLKDNVGTVQASTRVVMSLEEKSTRLARVKRSIEYFTGYVMTRSTWGRIAPILYEYEDRFLPWDVPYRKRVHHQIGQFIRETFAKPRLSLPKDATRFDFGPVENPFKHRKRWATGQDGITEMALWHTGHDGRLTTLVNRSIFTGETGEHFHPEAFRKAQFHLMTLDAFTADASRTEFVYA